MYKVLTAVIVLAVSCVATQAGFVASYGYSSVTPLSGYGYSYGGSGFPGFGFGGFGSWGDLGGFGGWGGLGGFGSFGGLGGFGGLGILGES